MKRDPESRPLSPKTAGFSVSLGLWLACLPSPPSTGANVPSRPGAATAQMNTDSWPSLSSSRKLGFLTQRWM